MMFTFIFWDKKSKRNSICFADAMFFDKEGNKFICTKNSICQFMIVEYDCSDYDFVCARKFEESDMPY